MAVSFAPLALDDDAPRRRTKEQQRAQTIGDVIMKQASAQEPVYSTAQGLAKIVAGGIGGYLDGAAERRQQAQDAAVSSALLSLTGGGGQSSATRGGGYNSNGKMPSFASGNMAPFSDAIASIESGGRYDAKGPVTASGDRAYGKHQVMGANIPSWTQAALGAPMTPEQFLADPQAQEATFAHRFGSYVDRYGPSGAAQAWFGGPGSVGKGGNASDILGTTGNVYVDKFNRALAARGGATAQAAPPGPAQATDGRPAYAYPVGDEPGAFNPEKNRTAAADLPAPGAQETALSIRASDEDTRPEVGFFIPPGPSPTPANGASGLDLPPPPAAPVNVSDASPPYVAPASPLLANPFTSPNADTPLPAAPAPLSGDVQPQVVLPQPALPGPLDPSLSASPTGPIAPSMAMPGVPGPDLASGVTGDGAPPLPPIRPDFANQPAPGAQEAVARLPPGTLPGPAPTRARSLADLVDPNSTDGGARAFLSLAANQDRQPPAASPAARMANIVAPSASPTAGAPMSILPPGASGGPSAGPNGPVAAAAPSGGGGFFDGLSRLFGGGPAVQTPSGPMSRADALATIVKYGDPATARWAIERADPKFGFQTLNGQVLRTNERSGAVEPAYGQPDAKSNDAGDAIVFTDGRGNEIRRINKVKGADFGVVGKDAYGNDVYGFRNYADGTVTKPPIQGASTEPPKDINGNPIPAGVDPTIVRKQQSESYAGNTVPADNKTTAELRKEIPQQQSYKNYTQAIPIYRSMVDTAGRNTSASDLNMVYGLAKLMDPGSVVREGETIMVNNTQGIGDRIAGLIARVNAGASLTPETRERLMTEAYSRMKAYEDEYSLSMDHYRGIAQRNRMNPDDVVPKFDPVTPWEKPRAPGAPSRSDIEAEVKRRGLR